MMRCSDVVERGLRLQGVPRSVREMPPTVTEAAAVSESESWFRLGYAEIMARSHLVTLRGGG